ncbi:MAG TPA: metallophosphoesterase, partial [Bryobacteraceae bacterium]|nr:metallophosphoesterase [Bryobacteraceae bacterium]
RIELGALSAEPFRNWVLFEGLDEDREYPYTLSIDGAKVAEGSLRTWQRSAEKVAFIVIGDFGNASSGQYRIAGAMAKLVKERASGDNPIRFVLTTGDNIYGDIGWRFWRRVSTGDDDSEWAPKFYEPYQQVLRSVPFYPTLGNHDGNMSEEQGDLAAYLDNFFFPPRGGPARWYSFNYGGLADFFGLDTTSLTEEGPPKPAFTAGGKQDQWLKGEMGRSQAPWKIPYFHNPPFSAGPRHTASAQELAHWLPLFQKSGVRVAFSGHEHNFQFSEVSKETGGIRYVISGAGGELRNGNVLGAMASSHIEGWSPQRHFLLVTIERGLMEITPMADIAVVVRNAKNEKIEMPLKVTLPAR